MITDNLYPIKFNTNGRLVKYRNPVRNKLKVYMHTYTIDYCNDIPLSKLVNWVNKLNGDLENAILSIASYYDDVPYGEIILNIKLTQEELDANEYVFLQNLKQYEEWLALSKDVKSDSELNARSTRAKSLKTQENNLLRKLEKIRKEQNNL